MLFNSYTFLLGFLPLVWLGHERLRRLGPRYQRLRLAWLTLASLVFYGWWSPPFLSLVLGSVVVNLCLGHQLRRARRAGRPARALLVLGLALNLGVLGGFKYARMLVQTANALGAAWPLPEVFLPLAISFFTFQQIAFLVDVHQGRLDAFDWLDYTLFVLFFPQLVAGPIVHHSEMLPQLDAGPPLDPWTQRTRGAVTFLIGLAKKVVIADSLAAWVGLAFTAEGVPTWADAWTGLLAYSFQIYFDFSGYSDMALGLGRLFGVELPINFDSPYQAADIADFWRRWHMTLSRFLRDYLYIPLGGNRSGRGRRYRNLLITMVLGGLWHGPSWSFALWGLLHGLYLVVHQGARALRRRLPPTSGAPSSRRARWPWRTARVALTFGAVCFAWVFFRAEDLPGAVRVLRGLAGQAGWGRPSRQAWLQLLATAGLVWGLPSSQRLLARWEERARTPAGGLRLGHWELAGVVALSLLSLLLLSRTSSFLYYQF